MTFVRATLLAAMLCQPVAALANCERDMHDITPKVQKIKDDSTRRRAQDYLQRAARELTENDDFECQTAVDAAQKILDSAPEKPGK